MNRIVLAAALWLSAAVGALAQAPNTGGMVPNTPPGFPLSGGQLNGPILMGIGTALTAGDFAFTDVQNAGINYGGNQAFMQYSNDASSAFMMFYKSRGTVRGQAVVVQNGDDIGEFSYQSEGGSGPVKGALINAVVDGATISATSVPTRLMFWTMATGGTILTERMRMPSAGGVHVANYIDVGSTSTAPQNTTDGDITGKRLALGDAALGASVLQLNSGILGATTAYGMNINSVINSGVTVAANLNFTQANTAVAAFTLPDLSHYFATQGTFGAGSAVTNQYGFRVAGTLTSATNNYGFYGNIASGSNRWNLYMSGTAQNFLAGNLLASSTTDASAASASGSLQVAGGASVAKRFWIPAISTSAGLQTAVLCQSSGGEMIADSVACLASGSQFKNILGPVEGGALDKLMKLPIDRWEYKAEGQFSSADWTRERIGPIAQDVAAMDPRLAGYDKEGNIRTFSPDQLLAFTIKAVQEHASKTDAEHAALKAENDNLRACNDNWKCRLFGVRP